MTGCGAPARARSSNPATASMRRLHRDLPQAAAVFHTHMPHASALARLVDNRILPIGQTELAR